MIFLFRANGIFASRVSKYVNYYQQSGHKYRIVGWDRLGENIQLENYDFFQYRTKYVQGGHKAILAYLKWERFVYNYLVKNSHEVTTIHACDLDVALPAVLFKLLHKKKVNIIFDVCDWRSASRCNIIMKNILMIVEKFTVRHCNHLVLCEPERIKQIQFPVQIPVHIMRNIPTFNDISFLNDKSVEPFSNGKVTVTYVGWFGNGRFIHELLDYAAKGQINLLIAGFGMASIEDKCSHLNKTCENVRYFGKVDYKYGLQIMKEADIIYAMYCKSIPNHFFAAPNKFYESMFLGKPILSTTGIPLEDKIKDVGTGYTIDETVEALENFFDNITIEELKKKGEDAHKQWPYFSCLTQQFMDKEYSKMIQ